MFVVYFDFKGVPGVVNSRFVQAQSAEEAIAKLSHYEGINKMQAFSVDQELLGSLTTLPPVVLEESFKQETLAFQNEALLEMLPVSMEKILDKTKYAFEPIKFIQVGDVYFIIREGKVPSLDNGKETTTIGVAFRGQVIRPSVYKIADVSELAV